MPEELDEEIEAILRRQDEAMALLERLRTEEPLEPAHASGVGGGRRDFRRWPAPEGVTIDLHDGDGWHRVDTVDLGIGGARLKKLPQWVEGPVPARLRAPAIASVLVLSDVMWREAETGRGGIRFEFADTEERDLWAGGLIDALLARHAVS